ncbi:CHAT domain-containing protein [Streptomyces sp. NPDC015346]|uniref:CHAT domain-containing protein n=1 Tax=Streptomyces sp. NPDC015346 TaxID=3364954 RepID=UPI0036FBCA9B
MRLGSLSGSLSGLRACLWILGAAYAVLPGARALSVYLDGPPPGMTVMQVVAFAVFGPLVAGLLVRVGYEPLIAESWRYTRPPLRVLLPLGCVALFLCLVLLALAVRDTALGLGFDLLESPGRLWSTASVEVRELWLMMYVLAAPVLIWAPLGFYEGPLLVVRMYLFRLAEKSVRAGDVETLRRTLAPLRRQGRLPSVNAFNEAVVASLDSLALLSRVERTEEMASLDACLAAARRGLAGMQALPGRRSARLLWMLRDNLGDALWRRYQDTRSSAALDELILIRREVLAAPRRHKGFDPRPYLIQLSEALGARFDFSGDEGDLREAVETAKRAVRARPLGKGPSVNALHNLGLQRMRGVREGIGGTAAWEAAVAALREGASLEEEAGGTRCHFQLALALLEAPREGPRAASFAASLAEAHETARGLVERAEPGTPAEAEACYVLGLVLLSVVDEDPEPVPALWEEATRAFTTAARNAALPTDIRLHAARLWGTFATATALEIAGGGVAPEQVSDTEERLWASGADGLALAAVELLPLVVWRGVAPHDQRHLLADLNELAVDAAAAAVGAGRPEQAVEILERGRTVMWSQLLDLRTTELSRLREDNPEMFARLDAIRDELDTPPPGDGRETPGQAERRTALAREWESLTRTAGVLRSPRYASLRAAAAEGPVVVVNVSLIGCHALLVRAEGPPAVVPLDALTHDGVREALDRTARADDRLVRAHAELRRARETGAEAGRVEAAEALVIRAEMRRAQTAARMLDWLWESVARPVLDALPELAAEGGELPRLWWCPTGLATYLPLHAAGARRGGVRESVPGRVVPSYAPTLTSLLHARRPVREPAGREDRLLLLTVPEPDLPEVGAEAEVVMKHVPGAVRLHDERATAEAVTRLLPSHTRFHAVCHGIAREGLRLGGGEILTPLQLSRVPAVDAEFAFLSACDTAVPDPEVPDEATHPAAVLHFGGFRHVLASLYPVQDGSAPAVTDAVYGRLVRDGVLDAARAPRALHAALAELRAEHPYQPKVWMPYIHVGA